MAEEAVETADTELKAVSAELEVVDDDVNAVSVTTSNIDFVARTSGNM
jgi:hypothetical protein